MESKAKPLIANPTSAGIERYRERIDSKKSHLLCRVAFRIASIYIELHSVCVCITKKSMDPLPDNIRHIGASEAIN